MNGQASAEGLYVKDAVRPEEAFLAEALSRLLPWFKASRRSLPWREIRDPYRIWVSEIMLQQTRIEAVSEHFRRFLELFPTITALADAEEEEVLKCWEGLGYYSRARNLKKAAEICRDSFGGRLPETREALKKLPGLGDYTAGAVASLAFGEAVSAVDGNVLRVLARLFSDDRNVLDTAVRREVSARIEALLSAQPERFPAGPVNEALMELGETLCAPAGQPDCGHCPWGKICRAHAEGTENMLPVRSKQTARRRTEMTVFLLQQGEKTAVRKRPQKGLLAGLYEFPHAEGKKTLQEVKQRYPEAEITPLGDTVHVFTHLEWHMTGYRVTLAPGAVIPEEGVTFITKAEIAESCPLPTAFRYYKEKI